MQTRFGRRAGVLIAATAAFAATTAPANAATCGSDGIADAAGDAVLFSTPFVGLGADQQEAPASLDIRQAYFSYATGGDGKKRLRANFVVENLDREAAPVDYSSTSVWEVVFWSGEEPHWARAKLADGEFTYEFERWEPPVPSNPAANPRTRSTSETTGSVVEGKMGTISIDIPAEQVTGFDSGAEFVDVEASSLIDAMPQQAADNDTQNRVDVAPDEGPTTWTVGECTLAGTPTTKPAVTPPAQTPPAPAAPQPEAPAAAPAETAAPAAAAPAAPVATTPRAVTKKAKSKKACAKAKKGRKARKAASCKAKKSKKARAKKR
jgi:hypothetical protein